MSGQTGIIYYGLVSDYTGDITKGCGLTASELDGNFYFLRGKEVSALTWDTDHFVITKYDGTTVESDAVAAYINDTITELLSGLTEAIDSVECMVSGLTNSIDGCYDEIDTLRREVSILVSGSTAVEEIERQISALTQDVNECKAEIDNLDVLVERVLNNMLSGLTEEEMETWFEDNPNSTNNGGLLGMTHSTSPISSCPQNQPIGGDDID